MIQVSSQVFGGLSSRFFRGVMRRGNEYRYTLRRFDEGDEAELYALAVMLRFRSIYVEHG